MCKNPGRKTLFTLSGVLLIIVSGLFIQSQEIHDGSGTETPDTPSSHTEHGVNEAETSDRKQMNTELTRLRDQYRKQLPDTYSFRTEPPFLIVSNLPVDRMKRVTEQTVLRAYSSFYHALMETKPNRAITVFLFKGETSYRKWARKLFGDRDVSHFGYFKSNPDTLVMNIATGTGTLVHEMTHAFMKYDFPEAPAWFNEGIGSLYEECRLTDEGPVGLKNWRLSGLRKAIKKDNLIDIDDLMKTSRASFYGDKSGLKYAEARYLMMYLQEKNVLYRFYRQFREQHDQDPTGITFLKQVLNEDSVETIQKNWIEWLKSL